jgi:hypothetical protein
MLDKVKEFFKKAWQWIQALWDKHDEMLGEMVAAVLPMVINVAFRNDLSGEQKRKVIVDAIIDNAEATAGTVSHSLLNEAVELAAARYNIQIGQLTVDRMQASRNAALKAGRDFANNTLKLSGTEAEDAGVSLTNEDLE